MRNTDWEDAVLREVVAEAARRAGVDAQPLADLVRARIEWGQSEYGDAWRTPGRDLPGEAREEAADGVVYGLLDLQLPDQPGNTRQQHWFEAMVHLAIADAHFRAARR